MIFKVQRPLTPGDTLMMVYNQDHSIKALIDDAELLELFEPDEYKVFVDGEVVEQTLHVERLVDDPGW